MLIVCYSHSSYDDIIQVQSDFLKEIPCKKYLIYDKPCDLQFDKVFIYDEKLNYTKRILQAVSQIEEEFFVLTQDNDILLNTSIEFLDKLVELMKVHSLDIIDLKNYACMKENTIPDESPLVVNYSYSYSGPLPLCEKNMIDLTDDLKIGIHSKVSKFGFVYNVQPKLVRKSAMCDIFNKFDLTYMQAENPEVQEYCKNTKRVAFLSCTNFLSVGYFYITPYYIFIHITNDGKLMPANPIRWGACGMNGQLFGVYCQILQKYKFHREMNTVFG